MTEEFRKKPPKGQLDEESKATISMQRFVKRHFFLSLLDAERSANEFWSRYNWQLKNQTIYLWLPKFLKGTERRIWLEKNIKDPDPTNPKERERIQAVIGRRLANMAFFTFQDDIGMDPTVNLTNEFSDGKDFGFSLANFVAEEKCADIENQRRSVKKLGKETLKRLIVRIFGDLDAGIFRDNRIARDFGLSKATFSRFAGSRWNASKIATIPDLWLNTAQVLSTNPDFKEIAIEAGVWNEVAETLKKAHRN